MGKMSLEGGKEEKPIFSQERLLLGYSRRGGVNHLGYGAHL